MTVKGTEKMHERGTHQKRAIFGFRMIGMGKINEGCWVKAAVLSD